MALADNTTDPPLNYEVEQAILGAILRDNSLAHNVSSFLFAKHFAEPVHGRIYDECLRRIMSGSAVDHRLIKHLFDVDGALADVDGGNYIRELSDNAISLHPASVKDYGITLLDLWKRRELLQTAEDVIGRLHDYGSGADSLLEDIDRQLSDLASQGAQRGPQAVGDVLGEAIEEIERRAKSLRCGVPTGFRDLDEIVGGFEAPDLVVLAGRPSIGKTALLTNTVTRQVQNGHSALIFSLEMSYKALVQRMLSERTGIPFTSLQRGRHYGAENQTKLATAAEDLKKLPLWIDDRAGLTVHQMHVAAKQMRQTHKLDLIGIDQLGHITPPDLRRGQVDRLGDVMKALIVMAKDLQVPVIALHQLSRASVHQDDKRPRLEHLRDSGHIEQDADIVLFLHREAYYLERQEPKKQTSEDQLDFDHRHAQWASSMEPERNVAEVIVAKQRNGPIDTCRLYFDGKTMRMDDLEVDQ